MWDQCLTGIVQDLLFLLIEKNPSYSVMYMEILLPFKLGKEITVMRLVI